MKQFSGRSTDERAKGATLVTGLSEQTSCEGTTLASLALTSTGPDQKPMGVAKSKFTGEYRGGDTFGFK